MQNDDAEDVTYYDPNEILEDSVNHEPILSTDSIGSVFILEDAGMNAETVRRAETAERYRINLKAPSAQDFSDISEQDGFNSSTSNLLYEHAGDMTEVRKQYSPGGAVFCLPKSRVGVRGNATYI